GYSSDSLHIVKRTLDPELLELNRRGFLNGHTPFSALLAFSALCSALLCGREFIVLSNEGSASEGNVSGASVNHQYSKSFEFERLVKRYFEQFLTSEIQYFSLLRPLNELQIARIFAKHPKY